MPHHPPQIAKRSLWVLAIGSVVLCSARAQTSAPAFGPSNPFFAPSTLPFHAPPFDRINDSDYQPAIEAGIAEKAKEIDAIANNPAPADFANTMVAIEKSGQLLERVQLAFGAMSKANTDPTLQRIQQIEAPKLAALADSQMLNAKLFARVQAIYKQRDALALDPESRRLVERTYDRFTHAGATLADADKERLKQINGQLAALSITFMQKLLAAAKASAYTTNDRSALAGLTDGQIAAAELAAKTRNQPGYVLPLQNTTQQPALQSLSNRTTRQALFESGWNRTEHGGDTDTREIIAQIAKLRAEKAKLLGFPTFAAWERPSKLMGTLPVYYNVANFPKPAPGDPALITYDNVREMFHEFGHALNGIFSSAQYPSLASLGPEIPRDFVEFPSQFNELWMSDSAVFAHYARHYKTGAAMPVELVAKLRKADTFNQGYAFTELLAAAQLDLRWHLLPADAPLQAPDVFEQAALEKKKIALAAVPPRYRSSYFLHIWANDYAAGYYGYLWSEMLDDDAFAWFTQHGGLTRANGNRFRQMVLSRGNTQDLKTLYENWRGGPPSIDGLLRQRGLMTEGATK